MIISEMTDDSVPQSLSVICLVLCSLHKRSVVAEPLRFLHKWNRINVHDLSQDVSALTPTRLKPRGFHQPYPIANANYSNGVHVNSRQDMRAMCAQNHLQRRKGFAKEMNQRLLPTRMKLHI